MNNTTIACKGYYTGLCNELALLLQLSFSEIKRKYINFPILLMDYQEKEIAAKSIEIRFDEEGLTVTCIFNEEESCNLIYIFPDKNEPLENLVADLNEAYEYNFIKSRWNALSYHICIRETGYPPHDIYVLLKS